MKASTILFAVTKAGSVFNYRQHFVAVPNLSFGLIDWEADLAVITKSGWFWEVEIKVSAADWINDAKKTKWARMNISGVLAPKRFYYAAPEALAVRWSEFGIPEWAGVVSVSRHRKTGEPEAKIIRPAQDRECSRKLTEPEKLKAARLGSMRFWGENHKRVQIESRRQEITAKTKEWNTADT